jgi:hypothetical protein
MKNRRQQFDSTYCLTVASVALPAGITNALKHGSLASASELITLYKTYIKLPPFDILECDNIDFSDLR